MLLEMRLLVAEVVILRIGAAEVGQANDRLHPLQTRERESEFEVQAARDNSLDNGH
jgi:hypothetical protein